MKKFQRKNCIITNKSPLEPIYTFPKFPICMNCVDSELDDDIFEDMEWAVGPNGNIQLSTLLDPNLIYKSYHNPGTVGKIWKNHHNEFYKFISQDHFSNVLEIGGASGLLATNFCQTSEIFKWTILEPSLHAQMKDNRVTFVNDYFETWDTDKKFDTLVHSHVFEHSYDPTKFLKKANSLLTANGLQYISIPNMEYWLSNGFTNTLSFEHTYYLDQQVLNSLLLKTGFEPLEWIINDHSIFVKAKKQDQIVKHDKDFLYIKEMFLKYIDYQKQDVKNITNKLQGKEFYLFGAHIFAQSLFNFGLDQTKVINILDNDIQKQDKRLYGTRCIVKSPKCLENISNPLVVLRGGSYTKEIQESLLTINPTVIFI